MQAPSTPKQLIVKAAARQEQMYDEPGEKQRAESWAALINSLPQAPMLQAASTSRMFSKGGLGLTYGEPSSALVEHNDSLMLHRCISHCRDHPNQASQSQKSASAQGCVQDIEW